VSGHLPIANCSFCAGSFKEGVYFVWTGCRDYTSWLGEGAYFARVVSTFTFKIGCAAIVSGATAKRGG